VFCQSGIGKFVLSKNHNSNSGSITGKKSKIVGYAAIIF